MTELLLAFDFPPIGGGIARWMAELALRYPPGELIVSTGTLPGADDRGFPGPIDRISIPSNRLRTLPGLWAWRRRVRDLVVRHRVDFVWCANIRPAGYVAFRTRSRDGIPYGIMVHGGDLLQLQAKYRRSTVKRRVARSLLGGAAAIVANSRWTADLARAVLRELGLEPADRLHVVPLGSDPRRFRPGVDAAPVASRLGIPPGRWLITVARLVPHKGIDLSLEVLARLRRTMPDLGLLVVGRGPDADRLGRLVDRLGLGGAVRFLDQVGDDDLPALYGGAVAAVGLSREEGLDVEGFGIALVDAAAAGLPVVAGASGGTADAVRAGETGLLVPPRDPAAVESALTRILADPALAQRMGAAGRRWVETEMNWDRVATDLRAISRAAASSARR